LGSKKPTFAHLAKALLHQTPYFNFTIPFFNISLLFYIFFSQLPKYLLFQFFYSLSLYSRCFFSPSPPSLFLLHFPPPLPLYPLVIFPHSPLPLSFSHSFCHSQSATNLLHAPSIITADTPTWERFRSSKYTLILFHFLNISLFYIWVYIKGNNWTSKLILTHPNVP
jgi:hypothetical protein